MRVAAHHLVGDRAGHVGEAEPPLLLGHAGVEHHLEQQVAQLVGQGGEVAPGDRVRHLIGFLDRVGRDAVEALRRIPWAAADRRAQGGHDVQQAAQLGFGIGGHAGPCGDGWVAPRFTPSVPQTQIPPP